MSRAIRYCLNEEEHNGDNSFDVTRPHPLSNPYTPIKNRKTKAIYVVDNRDDAVYLYEKYFDYMVKNSERFKKEWDRMYDAYKKYDTIYIGCRCKRKDKCHGDVIIKKLKQRAMKEMIDNIRTNRKTI